MDEMDATRELKFRAPKMMEADVMTKDLRASPC